MNSGPRVLAFTGSGVMDVTMPLFRIHPDRESLLHAIYVGSEDLLKLAGILFWCTYLLQTGFLSVSNALARVTAE